MKCPNCGCEMNDDAVFCISCGRRLVGEPKSAVRKEKNKAPLIIGIGLLAIVLIIGIACLLLLDPFSGKSNADLALNAEENASEYIPQQTEEPQETRSAESPQSRLLPEGARAIGTPETDAVGLPVPDESPELCQAAADQYWKFLLDSKTAQEYSLIDFLGDDIPELIVKDQQEDGKFCFNFYYFSDDTVTHLPTDEVTATSDAQLLSSNQTLMVQYAKEYINYITVDKNLTATTKFVKTDVEPEYTDSAVLTAVSDRSLLDVCLLGTCDGFSASGWIRKDGTDYYYQSGSPLTHHWVEEEGILYYLGDSACITEIADQAMISGVLDDYFAQYQKAFNGKDVSLLAYATENNRAEEEKRFQLEENKYLTVTDLTCETVLRETRDSDGSILADVHLEYTQRGEWKNAEDSAVVKEYTISLVWVDGQWFVDHIGNR